MRIVRPFLLTTLLLAAPASTLFAQGAPPKSAAPAASQAPTAKASAAPAAPAQHEIQTEVDNAMNEKAQALFKEGNQRFRDGKYADAQASYKAAWALDLRNQRIVNNLGTTELELHQYRDAAEHLTIALRLADPNDPKRAKIQTNADEARAKVGAVTFKLNTDGVEIVHMETGRSYQTPLSDPIFVEPGKASFRVRREGFLSQEKVVELKAGEKMEANITLDRAPGYGGAVSAAPTSSAAPTTAPRSKVPGFVLGGVGIVGLIAGGALLGVGLSNQDQNFKDAPKDDKGTPLCGRTFLAGEDPRCADMRSRTDSANLLGNMGIGLLAGGGVLAAAGVVYLLIPSKKAPDVKTSSLVPVVGSEGAGLIYKGSF